MRSGFNPHPGSLPAVALAKEGLRRRKANSYQ